MFTRRWLAKTRWVEFFQIQAQIGVLHAYGVVCKNEDTAHDHVTLLHSTCSLIERLYTIVAIIAELSSTCVFFLLFGVFLASQVKFTWFNHVIKSHCLIWVFCTRVFFKAPVVSCAIQFSDYAVCTLVILVIFTHIQDLLLTYNIQYCST